MLILSRKSVEKDGNKATIFIGDNIVITVLSINRNEVRIGIETPVGVQIMRGELLLDEERQRRQGLAQGGRT